MSSKAKKKGSKASATVGVQVESSGTNATAPAESKKPAEPKPDRTFLVIPAEDVAIVSCQDEKAAARAVAAELGISGRLIVVEDGYVEVHDVSHRIEVKASTIEKVIAEANKANEGE